MKTLPKEKLPETFHAVAQHRGWMDEVGVKLWVEKVWFLLQIGISCIGSVLWTQGRQHKKEIKN